MRRNVWTYDTTEKDTVGRRRKILWGEGERYCGEKEKDTNLATV